MSEIHTLMALAAAFLVFLVTLAAFGRWSRRWFKRLRHETADGQIAQELGSCKCGYPLRHLDRIRCPECGRVLNFNATQEELGLSDAELQRATAARLQREQRRSAGPASLAARPHVHQPKEAEGD